MFQRHPIQNQCPMLVTTNTAHREPIFADHACAREAIESLYRVQMSMSFFLFGFVIMPDHCHFVMNVPEGGSISKIMCAYKRSVCFEIGKQIWQSRFHVKIVDDIAAVLRYVHFNPVKKNLCEQIDEYPWSSASGRWDISELPIL